MPRSFWEVAFGLCASATGDSGRIMDMPSSQIHYADAENGERLQVVTPPSLVLSSAQSHWKGIIVEQLRLPPMDLPENFVPQHLLTLKLSPPSPLEWNGHGQYQSQCLLPGDVCLVPSGVSRRLRWHDEVEVLALALEPTLLASVAHETITPNRIELMESHGSSDPQVQHIGLALKAELESGCLGGRLYGESLATALAVHLLQRYNVFPQTILDRSSALSRSQLQRVLAYIMDNLDQDLALAEIAAVVQISPYYFARQFKQATGTAPHAFVLQQRVERAKPLLQAGHWSVGEIAQQLGFSDQSHFTRCFKRQVGLTPRAYQQQIARG